MKSGPRSSNLILRALIVTLLIAFGFYLVAELGLLQIGLAADKSYISYLILAIYLGASLHWLWLARGLSRERAQLDLLEKAGNEPEGPRLTPTGRLTGFLAHLENRRGSNPSSLLQAFADEMANRHALGHFLSDVLLKLGLMGTIVGFILMLMPVGEMKLFDPKLMQALLTSMSAGMSVALYTTLAGLVTSTLLKAQYYLLDTTLSEMINRLTVTVDIRLDSNAP